MSYTTFEYAGKSRIEKSADDTSLFTLHTSIKNTGDREGAETVQLYIRDVKSSLPRPVKELKGFQKVTLAPGEQRDITFTIDKSILSYYDDSKGEWVMEPGCFEALVGASACDIKSKVAFEVK